MQHPSTPPTQTEPQLGCIAAALAVLGDRWTALILRELTSGPQRFGALQTSLGISPRTLSQRLDSLEAELVVTKQCFSEVPPRVEYTLTQKGADLIPILEAMAAWGLKHPPSSH